MFFEKGGLGEKTFVHKSCHPPENQHWIKQSQFIERINSALISLLSNYAAIAFGIRVFEDNAKAFRPAQYP